MAAIPVSPSRSGPTSVMHKPERRCSRFDEATEQLYEQLPIDAPFDVPTAAKEGDSEWLLTSTVGRQDLATSQTASATV